MEKGPPKSEERVPPHKCVASSNKQTMRRECVEVRGGGREECKFAGKTKITSRSIFEGLKNQSCLFGEEGGGGGASHGICKCSCDSQKYCSKWDFFPMQKMVEIAYSYVHGIFSIRYGSGPPENTAIIEELPF